MVTARASDTAHKHREERPRTYPTSRGGSRWDVRLRWRPRLTGPNPQGAGTSYSGEADGPRFLCVSLGERKAPVRQRFVPGTLCSPRLPSQTCPPVTHSTKLKLFFPNTFSTNLLHTSKAGCPAQLGSVFQVSRVSFFLSYAVLLLRWG